MDFLLNLPGQEWGGLYLNLVLLGVVLGAVGALLALQQKWVREIR